MDDVIIKPAQSESFIVRAKFVPGTVVVGVSGANVAAIHIGDSL